MPRGGRRPGAGAPKGNTNAIKHGRYSSHAKALVNALATDPEAQRILLGLKRYQDRQTRAARRVARRLFYQLLKGLPPQPDQEFNQTIQELIRKLQTASRIQWESSLPEPLKGDSSPLNKNNQLPKEHNQSLRERDIPGTGDRREASPFALTPPSSSPASGNRSWTEGRRPGQCFSP